MMGILFDKAFSHSSTAKVIDKAYAVVFEFPFRTTAEMASKINNAQLSAEQLHKALSRLLQAGRVQKVQTRRCTVTCKLATTWAPAAWELRDNV